MTKAQLTKEIKQIRKKGYSENKSELSKDLFAVAVPLLNEKGQAVAGINIVIPTTRVSKKKIFEEYLPSLIKKGQQISAALGYHSEQGMGAGT